MPKPDRPRLTSAMEDYVKVVYQLQHRADRPVATNDIADAMQVSPSSATAMVKALAKLGLISHERYHGARLTPAGERVALEVIRHHRLLERYLQEFLGFGWDEVHDEADRLEHAISERLEERLAEVLGEPATDPHGDPIPSRDGRIVPRTLVPLPAIPVGTSGTVGRVDTSDPEKLRYLAASGLVPGASVELLYVAPFDGPLTLRAGGEEISVGPGLAASILIAEAPGQRGTRAEETDPRRSRGDRHGSFQR